jgi:hypothetical protein
VDVTPRRVQGEAPRPKREPGRGGGTPWRGKPQEGIGARVRKGVCRTSSHRERGPVAGRVSSLPMGGGEFDAATARGQGLREEHPSVRGEGLEEGSPWTLRRARRVGRGGGGRRDGGEETPDAARGAGDRDPPSVDETRVHRPVMCRRARKPRRGSIVRPAGSPGGTVRECGDGPLERSESEGGAPVRETGSGAPFLSRPGGRRNAERVGCNPMCTRAGMGLCPRIAAQPQERAAVTAVRRCRGSHLEK